MRVYVCYTHIFHQSGCMSGYSKTGPHAGKRASSPLLIEAEEEDEMGGKGSKSEMRDLEDRLMHRFTPDFPWDAFEAAATKLKVITGMGLAFACPHSCTCEVLYL